jgi:hypothetical protein
MSEEGVVKMMRLLLDGPHDEVDWMEEEQDTTIQVFQDFFTRYRQRMTKSPDSHST